VERPKRLLVAVNQRITRLLGLDWLSRPPAGIEVIR
jgi:hypothetical protein